MSKNDRIYDLKTPFYAEKYAENDGTIAGSPNLPKVVVFDEILPNKKKMHADLDSQLLISLYKKHKKTKTKHPRTPKTQKRATA